MCCPRCSTRSTARAWRMGATRRRLGAPSRCASRSVSKRSRGATSFAARRSRVQPPFAARSTRLPTSWAPSRGWASRICKSSCSPAPAPASRRSRPCSRASTARGRPEGRPTPRHAALAHASLRYRWSPRVGSGRNVSAAGVRVPAPCLVRSQPRRTPRDLVQWRQGWLRRGVASGGTAGGGRRMRGRCNPQLSMLAFVDLDARIPAGHPLRTIKGFAEQALAALSPVFDRMYAAGGRPSIPPERLLKASLLIALYSVRSERAFCEELEYHLLYRWFLDMDLLEPSFDASTFAKNRQRLLQHDVAQQFFDEVVLAADRLVLLSDAHFTVDGTLIEAAASLKSFRAKQEVPLAQPMDIPGNPTVDFRGER